MTPTPRVYIAGPMSGLPEYNVPAFNVVAAILRGEGFDVFNPAAQTTSLDVQHGRRAADAEAYREMMGVDLAWITSTATHMYMLSGWETSKGARAEYAVAIACGLTIMYE